MRREQAPVAMAVPWVEEEWVFRAEPDGGEPNPRRR